MMIRYFKKIARFLRNRLVAQPVVIESGRDPSWEVYKKYIKVHPSVIIAPSAIIKIFNPPNPPEICLEIGEGCHIFSHFNILRPSAKIKIGKRCQLGSVSFICANSVEVGDDVLMAWGITILDSDNHSIYWDERQHDVENCRNDYIKTNGADLARSHDWETVNVGKVIVGHKSWIGFNVIILKEVTIGEGAIVGAGSVVTKDVEPWHVGAGNPFKHIRKLERCRSK